FVGVVGALDVDRVGRARPRAQFTADALLESVRIPVELVASVVAGCGGSLLFRILLGVGLLEHRRERHTETGERAAEFDHHDPPGRRPAEAGGLDRVLDRAGSGGTGKPPAMASNSASTSAGGSVAWARRRVRRPRTVR